MKAPRSHQVSQWGKELAFLILGFMIGVLIFLYTHGHTLDKILLENRRLALEVIKLQDEVAYWQKRAEELDKQSQRELTVNQIEIEIVNEKEIDGFAATDIMEQLREELKYLIEENYTVQAVGETAETLAKFVDGKIITFEDESQYRLHLLTLIIYSKITLKIHVQKIN